MFHLIVMLKISNLMASIISSFSFHWKLGFNYLFTHCCVAISGKIRMYLEKNCLHLSQAFREEYSLFWMKKESVPSKDFLCFCISVYYVFFFLHYSLTVPFQRCFYFYAVLLVMKHTCWNGEDTGNFHYA